MDYDDNVPAELEDEDVLGDELDEFGEIKKEDEGFEDPDDSFS